MNKVSFLFSNRFVHTHAFASDVEAYEAVLSYRDAVSKVRTSFSVLDETGNAVFATATVNVLMCWVHD